MHAVITPMRWAIVAAFALAVSPDARADCDLRFAPMQIREATRAHLSRDAAPASEPAPADPPRTSPPDEPVPLLPQPAPEPRRAPDSA